MSFNEFHMLHDLLAFDEGLLKSARETTMYAQIDGFEVPKAGEKRENKVVKDKERKWHVYSRPDPEQFRKIEEFARERGVWEGMVDAGRVIQCQKEENQVAALQFQVREAHRMNDRKRAAKLRPLVNAKQDVVRKLKEEMAVIEEEREEKQNARVQAAKEAEEAVKKAVEQEEARKQRQKPQ